MPETPSPNPQNMNPMPNESLGGSRGDKSGAHAEQARAVGGDNPLTEGSRMGRERYKDDRATGQLGPAGPGEVEQPAV